MSAFRSRGPALGAGILVILAVSGVSAAEEPFVNTPPPPSAICPAIEQNYELCANDLLSGNCPDFVSSAAALGRLYLFTVQREPGQAEHLQTSIWWGCGSKHFSDLKALLVRIDSPQARAVLKSEPYRSLPAPRSAARVASPPRPRPPTYTDCESGQTASERSACAARELATAQAEHQRTFEACKATLTDFLRSRLVAQERAWKMNLQLECARSDTQCLTTANRRRDEGMRAAFPQCAAPGGAPSVASDAARPAKTGMLPARWTGPHGQTQAVPFGFEAQSASTGTMSTTLGRGGERFHGSYVRVEKSPKGHLVTVIYDGWSSPEWETWKHDPDGQWTATGVSFGEFARFYTGKVVATLSGSQGGSMRCQLTLKQPESGLVGGGSGTCQISDGGRLALEF